AWTPIAPLPTARSYAAAVSDGSFVYIIGGNDAAGMQTSTLWRYDPATNSYTSLAPYTTPTFGHGAAYLNGEIYRIAGYAVGGITGSVEAYTIATNTWAPVANYPNPRFLLNAVGIGGFVYAGGGNDRTLKTAQDLPLRPYQ